MAERTLLLVDDEPNILRALTRLLRRDGYRVLAAGSGKEGLEILGGQPVGVILADQRMPGMIGSEFLERAKAVRPRAIRIMLSGYTDLESVTDAINRGAVHKFLTKPWDDDLLRENVRLAFEQYELVDERDRLARELRRANARLGARVADQDRDLDLHRRMLERSRDVLEQLPVGVIGIGDDGLVSLANESAHRLLAQGTGQLPGRSAADVLPPTLVRMHETVMTGGTASAALDVAPDRSGLRCYGVQVRVHGEPAGSVVVIVGEERDGD